MRQEMKTYEIEVIELHEVKKTYYIEAKTKAKAQIKAKNGEWDDASPDEYTGNIYGRKLIK